MSDFINFFKKGEIKVNGKTTNLRDAFTKDLPAAFKKIPPPAKIPVIKINVDKDTKDFFTKGTTDSINRSNLAVKNAFDKSNADIKNAFDKSNAAIKDGFDKSGIVNFFENDVKNGLKDGLQIAKNTFEMPLMMSNLMKTMLESANTPLLLPIIAIAGFAIVANKM